MRAGKKIYDGILRISLIIKNPKSGQKQEQNL